ncbi:hypothetical protein CXF59_13650 [Flavobacterium sp. ALD4]|uniref:hypothetical protein n=1 Tax=Flavobacterium sp. ALD4 TaxID=2058314 RepID=UPI000C334F6A|nr:hypothetical protein [Flavobacterium sp. ALD4]PKH66949.1 hypothetical protein CXF59_13650 [Flavobacterium sp. ALD4]
MKKIILITVMGLFTSLIFAQEKGTFDITASLNNQWYWRGYAVGPDPLVSAQASFKYKGLEIGTWNGMSLSGTFKDVDTYISYSNSGFTISLWDIFNYSDYTASAGFAGYLNHTQANYFNYGTGTRHFIDLSIGYAIPKTNLNLFLATIIGGRDRNADHSQRYSSYFKASYNFSLENNVTVSPYVSYGFALNSDGGGTFWQWTDKAVTDAKSSGFNEIGINISKPIKITDTYSIKASAGAVASPINHTMTGLLGVTLF